jgi:hypothetical protein
MNGPVTGGKPSLVVVSLNGLGEPIMLAAWATERLREGISWSKLVSLLGLYCFVSFVLVSYLRIDCTRLILPSPLPLYPVKLAHTERVRVSTCENGMGSFMVRVLWTLLAFDDLFNINFNPLGTERTSGGNSDSHSRLGIDPRRVTNVSVLIMREGLIPICLRQCHMTWQTVYVYRTLWPYQWTNTFTP